MLSLIFSIENFKEKIPAVGNKGEGLCVALRWRDLHIWEILMNFVGAFFYSFFFKYCQNETDIDIDGGAVCGAKRPGGRSAG